MRKTKQLPEHNQSTEQFFQYRYAPFSDTFEIHTPFLSETDTINLKRCLQLITEAKSFALYGEAGTGKSMFIKTLITQLDAKNYRVALLPYGGLKPSVLIREVCEGFDLDTSGRKTLLYRLYKDFRRNNDNAFPIIIIDDAHTMQHQSFIDLCSLLHDPQTRTASATLILVGQPSLKRMIELDIYAPVRTRLTCLFTMPKLSTEQAQQFILYRLKLAQADTELFHPDALQALALDSNGNRRILMNMATLCLQEAARRQEAVITNDIVNQISTQFIK